MAIDIEQYRWRAAQACEAAGIDDPITIRMNRKHHGLRLGKFEANGWRYSVLDIAELSALPALRALGFGRGSAIAVAHEHLRLALCDVLNNRLVHGFWSLSVIELNGENAFAKRTLYLDHVAERVIAKLKLPMPGNVLPRTPEVALRMVDAIFDYIESPPGRLRWQAWHKAALARGGNVPMPQAAAELGAPVWFLLVLDSVLRKAEAADRIAEAVRPRAPKVADHMRGVTLQ